MVLKKYLTLVNKNISWNGFASYSMEELLFILSVDSTHVKEVITVAAIPSAYSLCDNAGMLN